MIKTITTDSNNDLLVTNNKSISMSSDLDAISLICEHTVKTMLGELILQGDIGIPNFQLIWNGSPNIPQAENAIREAIMGIDGVISVPSLSAFVENNTLVYNATIQTIYGEASLVGL